MEPSDVPKTAFSTRSGLYEFLCMPYRLCNAAASCERLMELVLKGMQWHRCLLYMDDIISHAITFENELKNLEEIFQRLSEANLK